MPIKVRDADGVMQTVATLDDVLAALGPAQRWSAVAPSDSTELENVVALKIANAGTLAAVDADGNQASFACFAGEYLPIAAVKVMATGTTATGIVALRRA